MIFIFNIIHFTKKERMWSCEVSVIFSPERMLSVTATFERCTTLWSGLCGQNSSSILSKILWLSDFNFQTGNINRVGWTKSENWKSYISCILPPPAKPIFTTIYKISLSNAHPSARKWPQVLQNIKLLLLNI